MFAWVREIDKMVWVIAAVIAVVVGLMGISQFTQNTGIHAGTVSEKEHRDAFSTTSCAGEPLICTTNKRAEYWQVTIVDGEDSNWFRISEEQFAEVHEGDYLVFHGDTLVTIR